MAMNEQAKRTPRRVILYSLVEAMDVAWLHGDILGDPSAVVKIMEVDFQRRTIVLPKGKFDLAHFLRQVQNMLSRYDNPDLLTILNQAIHHVEQRETSLGDLTETPYGERESTNHTRDQ